MSVGLHISYDFFGLIIITSNHNMTKMGVACSHDRLLKSGVSIVGSLRDREVACSASDRQGSNFESCVWRTVSSQSSHHPQEVLLAQFSLYVHKGGLKPDSFHFISFVEVRECKGVPSSASVNSANHPVQGPTSQPK